MKAGYLDPRVERVLSRLQPTTGQGADVLTASTAEIAALRDRFRAIRDARLTPDDRAAMATLETEIAASRAEWDQEEALAEVTQGRIQPVESAA